MDRGIAATYPPRLPWWGRLFGRRGTSKLGAAPALPEIGGHPTARAGVGERHLSRALCRVASLSLPDLDRWREDRPLHAAESTALQQVLCNADVYERQLFACRFTSPNAGREEAGWTVRMRTPKSRRPTNPM